MKKHIIITLILLAATAYVTVVYFKNLNPPGSRTSLVLSAIPDDAPLIFEFNNDKSFYDIFKDNKLFAAFIGAEKLGQLDTLRQALLQNRVLGKYFNGQDVFISLHPSKTEGISLLLTMSPANGFEPEVFDDLLKQKNSGLVVTPMRAAGKSGYNIYISALKKRFYLINKGNNVFSGSFSEELANQSASHKNTPGGERFVLLSDQQNNNSLANFYVNYNQLNPLFEELFKNKNTDIFKNFRMFPALAALSLNYRTDAIMFNGSTSVKKNERQSYLSIFTGQQPVPNHLKEMFPSTTAYCTSFSVSNPQKFAADLIKQQNNNNLDGERDDLFSKIKAETGVKIKNDFDGLLGNEFAIVTTRYFEKFGIVSVKDGSRLKVLLTAMSIMSDENTGQLSYEKLPSFLLGDAFNNFKRPYFMIIDNYLIFANSSNELASYYDIYINRKFLSKNEQFNQFDELLAAQSNVSFFFHFKNALPVLERDMAPGIYDDVKSLKPGWGDFYGASVQLSAVDNNFYTNFCLKLNSDTTANKQK
ncbi:hypothetical protein [Mucilaginibacter sp. L3T2-6]|uniref:hypothetical protein n=1 Tax=Mucilaginibacter sp. L3T2-6 TaxID=3062491 RepID=UPI0026767FF6|nr:hypothetical protein [Mucilaginibacter sp. L3T2-6]MDO3640904.1 hypothetical protein [Mucilaginibacter sp. L3T2-6]MDV6213620.1 hypothetical protein [Mucilaginibacter sp. L3T2-6]